jgi:hypothetical protein
MLKTILNENARLKTKLYNPIIKFVYKYMLKLFEKEKSYHNNRESRPSLYPDFQRRLLQITKWSDKKLDKQYSKFLKWVQKREDLSEEQIYKLLKDIIRLSTQIIINKSDVYVDTLLQNYKLPQLKTYYYKCLRRIARRVYENPKDFESSLKNEDLINDLENILQDFLPLDKIKTVLEFVEDPNIKEKDIHVEYNFEDDQDDNSSISLRNSLQNVLLVDKRSSDRSLHYVSSDDLAKNYDYEDNNIKGPVNIIENNIDYEDGVKHITVPTFKKSKYFYNKPKINEINEYFFNE